MHGSVSPPCSNGRDNQSFLDAIFRDLQADGTSDCHMGVLDGYNFLWETLKEEDISPSSTSLIDTATATTTFALVPDDEELISSSTRSCDDGPPSPSEPLVKPKQALNSPPDDVRAFFGHPLTRATNALNGESLDTNANAEALLHEYINLSVLDRDDLKANEKVPRFIDAISSKRSDPQLTTSRSASASSPAAADSPGTGKTSQDVVEPYGKEVSEESNQTGESMYIGEYVDIFLDTEFSLDLIDGRTERQAEASVTTQARLGVPARIKSKKGVQGSTFQKRALPVSCQRAPRKSRSKSDLVSSTTNGLLKHKDCRTVKKDLLSPVSHKVVTTIDAHQFQQKDLPITSEASQDRQPDSAASTTVTTLSRDDEAITTSNTGGLTDVVDNSLTVSIQQHTNQQLATPTTNVQNLQNQNQILTVSAPTLHSNTISVSLPNDVTSAIHSQFSASPAATSSISSAVTSSPTQAIPKDNVQNVPPLKETNLKKVLSEKIRSRQTTEDTLCSMSANTLQFMPETVCGMGIETKFSPAMSIIKQEPPYNDLYQHSYIYGSEPASSMVSLTNYSALALTSFANVPDNVTGLSVTMTSCSDILTPNDANNNGLNVIIPSSIQNESIENSGLHHHHHHHHQSSQQQNNINNMSSNHHVEDAMIVQSSQGQYFQVLQPLQPFESHSQVSSTNPGTSNITNAADSLYNVYQSDPNSHLLDTEKQVVVEHYLHQQHQYAYGGGYASFLNHGNNYSMKSPDSGYQEPCLSPTRSAMVLKDMSANASSEARKQKPKKKKLTAVGGDPERGEDNQDLIKQFSTSRSDKSHPKSPEIPKLEDNPTGYTYFLETPISTTRHRDEDRVTYVNKSQYYGLTLEFNSQDRAVKYAGVKSVIILTFREEKTIDEEKKAWEYWHGRQHSYKQRILDIDTKNCHGITPQNIEEIAFNAVAVMWNPTEGPIRVNIAVHCLSTDFSNQKGVKGIPLHIQIDTYEHGPKDNFLVHRGYCQIKAFCDKGAERKTRDEERRKASKGKTEEYGGTPGVAKGRRKTEEAFHDPCDRSEFYSMVNKTTPPVFFNPLHENTEFIHKSLFLGVVPSQDEEISSVPSSLQLPDSCDDYYINSPAKRSRRDSCSNPKDQQKILLYVRERQETVYTALMLQVPTLNGLLKSIEQKYCISPFKVKNLYKKSRKGILVKIDDNIVRHYSHESTFIIEINLLNDNGDYEIILIELDAITS